MTDSESVNLTQLTPKAAILCEITRKYGQNAVVQSLKATDFGTDRKLVRDFLSVNNTNIYHMSQRFWVIAAYCSNCRFWHGCRSLAQNFGVNPRIDCEIWPQKLETWTYWTTYACSPVWQTDRQTDGRTDGRTDKIAIAIAWVWRRARLITINETSKLKQTYDSAFWPQLVWSSIVLYRG